MGAIEELKRKLVIPVIASPMFIVSGPELVIEQCKVRNILIFVLVLCSFTFFQFQFQLLF